MPLPLSSSSPSPSPRLCGNLLNRVAFPLGGLGAGMICIEGTGALSHVSLRHQPGIFNEPGLFSALWVRGTPTARVLEGPVPKWKAFGGAGNGNGRRGGCPSGLPRFSSCEFEARFPFATVRLQDPDMPVGIELTGWSPFTPGDPDNSSLPVLALEYRIHNKTKQPVEGVYSFHAPNFMALDKQSGARVRPLNGGFVLTQPPMENLPSTEGYFAAFVDDSATAPDCAWFRGGWFDSLTMLWRNVMEGGAKARPAHAEGRPSPGGSLYLPFSLPGGGEKTIRLQAAWYVPRSDLRLGHPGETPSCLCDGKRVDAPAESPETYRPWYTERFADIEDTVAFWRKEVEPLRRATQAFTNCFYDTTLPPEAVEAAAANLTILKSPTCLRQADGRFWAWEGCCDGSGCCAGSCTHVWNYAQAMPHLFPSLERSLRETEFFENQDERGHQAFRASLPIGPVHHDTHAAADGQLGGIMKVYREWRISGDTAWMQTLWPRVKASLLYGIETWDPDHLGALVEPHHNTYDIEFWGADGMCTSIYLGALAAAVAMGRACQEDTPLFESLLEKGRKRMEEELWNGEYFIQKTQWQGLRTDPAQFKALAGSNAGYSPEALALLQKEGPKYQYGKGCLSDGVLGDWLARCCGLDSYLDPDKVRGHLDSVFRYNFKNDLSSHSNPQRSTFAFGDEGGLLLCSWPHGGKPALPFVYSEEVWTGIEYQAAAHLILLGRVEKGLELVRAVRARYNGHWRNPFDEYECGHWYARAMASFSLLQALGGARYDAVERVLTLAPKMPGDFRVFLCTAGGFGTVGVRGGTPFVEVVSGKIPVRRIELDPTGIEETPARL